MNPSFFFKEASFGDSLVDECTLLLNCFAIVGNISIQFASPCSKTIF